METIWVVRATEAIGARVIVWGLALKSINWLKLNPCFFKMKELICVE